MRYADDCTVFCKTPKAANRVRKHLITFIEDTMGCPVNRDKTKAVPVDSLSILGLHRHNGRWCLNREKEKTACGTVLSILKNYEEKGEYRFRENACQVFQGFLNVYRHIPDLATTKVPALERWMTRKLQEADPIANLKRWGDIETPF